MLPFPSNFAQDVQGDKCNLGLHFVVFFWKFRSLPDSGKAAVSMAE